MFDVAVIGAGVVGGMIARELSRHDLKICILEAEGDVALGATRANSAIVHAGFDAKEGSLKAKLNVLGSYMMEGVCSELGVKYKKNGSLVVGFNEEDERTLGELLERGKKNGVRGLSILKRDEILAIEPNIGTEVTVALRAESGAIVCPYELCLAAVGNAMDNGVELRLNFRVAKIEKSDGYYTLSSADDSVRARWVINCAGVYSDEVASLAGKSDFTVRPRRGEYILLDKECGGLVGHTVFRCPSKMGKGVLVTPTVDGNLLIGPTADDIDDKRDVATTVRGMDEVKRKASLQVAGINFGKTITTFAGLRAVGSTGDFIINESDRFINVAAIESPGLSASPAIAMYVLDLMLAAGELLLPREDFIHCRRPAHYFRELSEDEKNEIIKKDPSYAHVICRCETVTEGEIREAIRTNPRPSDVDGVKRRTRASMGRCQGGFCLPYIVELLADELGIPYDEVTKLGGDSKINIGKTKEDV